MNLWYWWSLKITCFDINSWIPGCLWSSYPWRQKIWWWEKSHNLLRSTITLVTIPARMQKSIETYTTSLRFFASIVQQQNHLIEVPAAKFQHPSGMGRTLLKLRNYHLMEDAPEWTCVLHLLQTWPWTMDFWEIWHLNTCSMDWFKPKFTGLSQICNGKIYGFRLRFNVP